MPKKYIMQERVGKNEKFGKTKFISILVTFLVLGLLVIAGPARALEASLEPFDNKPLAEGEIASTIATISLNSSDIFNILSEIELEIDGPDDNDRLCIFELDGTPISGCEGINITLLNDTTFGYGYGYGYGYDFLTNGNLVYNITINTTGFHNGNYFVTLFAEDVESSREQFQVGSLPEDSPGGSNNGGGGGSSGGSLFTNPETDEPIVFPPQATDGEIQDGDDAVARAEGEGQEQQPTQRGFFGRITGTAIGTLGPGGALASLIFFLILLTVFIAAIVFIVQQKRASQLPQTPLVQGPYNREFSY